MNFPVSQFKDESMTRCMCDHMTAAFTLNMSRTWSRKQNVTWGTTRSDANDDFSVRRANGEKTDVNVFLNPVNIFMFEIKINLEKMWTLNAVNFSYKWI